MAYQYDLYVGSPQDSREYTLNTIIRETSKVNPGFTILDSVGAWRAERESCFIVRICTRTQANTAYYALASRLAEALRQECIMLTRTRIDVLEFVAGRKANG